MNRHSVQLAVATALVLLLASCKPDGPKSLQRGKAEMEKRAYANAIIEFRNALKAMPQDAEAHYQMGLALMAQGDMPGGLGFLRRATEIDPKHAGAQTRLAEIMAASGNSDVVREAERRAKLLSGATGGNDALAVLALADLRLGRMEEGVRKLEDILAKSPQAVKAAAVLAQVKLAKGDTKGAEELLRKAAEADPKAWEGWMTLARFYMSQKQLPEAEKLLNKVLELDPNNEMALSDLGTIQIAGKRMTEAEATYTRLSQHPSKRFRGMHALFLFQTGKRDEGVKELEQLYKDNSGSGELRSQLMAAYLQTNQIEKAEKMLANAVKLMPKDQNVLLQHGMVLAQLNRIAELEAAMTKAIELNKNSPEAHYLMSRVYQARNDRANQERELREALQLQPSLSSARVELSQILLLNNRPKEAIELLNAERAPGQTGESLAVVVQKNWIFYSQGELDKMREGIKQGYQAGRVPDILVQDALLNIREKHYARGRELLTEALAQRPSDTRILAALAESYLAEDRKNVAQAVAAVEQHAAKYPKDAALQQFRGNWLVAANRIAEGRAAFEAAQAANPNAKAPAFALVRLDLGTGNYEGARKSLSDMLAKDPKDAGANLLNAMLQEQTGKGTDAVDSYRKVLAVEPSNALALNNLAYKLSVEPGKLEEAAQMAEKARLASPDNPAVLDTLGWIQYRKGMYLSSVRHLESATKNPQNATPVRLLHLAMAYQKAGDRGKASATYKRAVQVAEANKITLPAQEVEEARKLLGV